MSSNDPPQWAPPSTPPEPGPPMRSGTGLPRWAVPLIIVVGVALVGGVIIASATRSSSSHATTSTTARPAPVTTGQAKTTVAPTITATPTTAKPITTTAPAPTTTRLADCPSGQTRYGSNLQCVPVTTTTERATTTTAKSAIIPAGTYVVNTDIAPGVYRVEQYWARLDADQHIIDNDLVSGKGLSLVNIQPDDAFIKFSGDAIAVTDSGPVDPIAKGFDSGTYLVATDIQPGRYRISQAEGAYFARLNDKGDIIDNDLGDGSVIVTVRSSDWALQYSGTIERL